MPISPDPVLARAVRALVVGCCALAGSGCLTTAERTRIHTVATQGLKDLAPRFADTVVRFDPYNGTLELDEGRGAALFEQHAWAVHTQIGHPRRSSFKHLHPTAGRKSGAGRRLAALVPGRWYEPCLRQLSRRMWAVCQTDIAKGSVNFGDYRVPSLLIGMTFIAIVGDTHLDLSFAPVTVKGPGLAHPTAPALPAPAAPAPITRINDRRVPLDSHPAESPATPAVGERLLQLDELRKSGVISAEEYERERRRILESL